MITYTLALLGHIVLFAYLLGTDLGRLYLARTGGAAGAAVTTRLTAARGVLWIGSITNAALVLFLPAGVSLGGLLGVYRISSPIWLVITWAVAAAWLALSVAADRAATRPEGGRGLEGADMIVRLVFGAGNAYDGLIYFMGTSRTITTGWLATKLMLYGLLIVLSVPLRRAGFRTRRALAALAAQPGSETAASGLSAALGAMTVPLLAGWLVILATAWMGISKSF